MTDTLIFDLDGTLLSTLDDILDSVNYALGKKGFPLRTYDEVRMMVGNSTTYLMNAALPENHSRQDYEECLESYNEYYIENMYNHTAPYSGIMQMLREAKQRGYKTAVVSNKDDNFTKLQIRRQFGDLIDIAVGKSEGRERKPAPDGVLYALEELGSEKDDSVYIGDTEVDALTAQNSGLVCIGCLWGFRDRRTLEEAGVKYLIGSPSELFSMIKEADNER